MVPILIVVLIATTFGFVFAKLDSLAKACKILKNDVEQIQKDIASHAEKHQ